MTVISFRFFVRHNFGTVEHASTVQFSQYGQGVLSIISIGSGDTAQSLMFVESMVCTIYGVGLGGMV